VLVALAVVVLLNGDVQTVAAAMRQERIPYAVAVCGCSV